MADVLVLNNLGGGQSVQVDQLPLPGHTVKGYNWRYNIDAGKGPNSCICMGRLGVRAAFIGKAGKDAPGDRGENWMVHRPGGPGGGQGRPEPDRLRREQ